MRRTPDSLAGPTVFREFRKEPVKPKIVPQTPQLIQGISLELNNNFGM